MFNMDRLKNILFKEFDSNFHKHYVVSIFSTISYSKIVKGMEYLKYMHTCLYRLYFLENTTNLT